MCPGAPGTEAPGLGTLPDLTLAAHLDPLLYNKPVDLSECSPESCELFQRMAEPEKGVVGTPLSSPQPEARCPPGRVIGT